LENRKLGRKIIRCESDPRLFAGEAPHSPRGPRQPIGGVGLPAECEPSDQHILEPIHGLVTVVGASARKIRPPVPSGLSAVGFQRHELRAGGAFVLRLFDFIENSLRGDIRRSFLKLCLFLRINAEFPGHVIQQPDYLGNFMFREETDLEIQVSSFVGNSRQAVLRDQYKGREKDCLN
jgi:hypothetical protein